MQLKLACQAVPVINLSCWSNFFILRMPKRTCVPKNAHSRYAATAGTCPLKRFITKENEESKRIIFKLASVHSGICLLEWNWNIRLLQGLLNFQQQHPVICIQRHKHFLYKIILQMQTLQEKKRSAKQYNKITHRSHQIWVVHINTDHFKHKQ